MPAPAPLPEALRDRPFSVREAADLDVGRDRTRRSDLGRPFRGIRVPATSDAVRERHADETAWGSTRRTVIALASALATTLDADAAFSHATAAHLHGMPLPWRLATETVVHVSVARQEDRPQIRRVVSHLAPRDVHSARLHTGLPVTSPVSTWVALASVLSVRELVELGDHLVKRRDPLATMDDLRSAVRNAAGRHGVLRLRKAIELIRPRTDSVRESRLRMILVDAGLPEPDVNFPILDLDGCLIRHGDMAYPGPRVLVEYDGEQHRTDEAQYRLDREQLDRILSAGWLVVHVLKEHLDDPAALVRRVRRALISRSNFR